MLTDKAPDSRDAFEWKWQPGAATTKSEFGDPVHIDDYVVCLYDGSGLLATLLAPAGGVCGGPSVAPCCAVFRTTAMRRVRGAGR